MSEEEAVTLSEGEWFASDGVKGTGDTPEWYDQNKYSSVAAQAQAYPELSRKFGGFTGAPKDGYTLPEGMDAEDDMLKTFTEYATGSNMNQANFDKGFALLTAQSDVTGEVSQEAELEKLGENADARIEKADQFLSNNLSGRDYEEIKGFVTTADAVRLVEMLIPATATGNLPNGDGAGTAKLTRAEVDKQAFKKDDNGNYLRSVDPAYDKKILALYAQLHA